MSTPKGHYPLAIALTSKDMSKSVAFYRNVLGFELETIWPDADQPMWAIRTVERMMDSHLAGRRFVMILMGVFAALAMVLAAVGVYGVVSHAASQGIREIGIRMAVGATAADIKAMVLTETARLSLIGAAAGAIGAIVLTRSLSRSLPGVSPGDPLTLVLVSIVLVATTVGASVPPARRATRVDPMAVLRSE